MKRTKIVLQNLVYGSYLLPENVRTQEELPIGAPSNLSLIGASVSCQVHQRNFAP